MSANGAGPALDVSGLNVFYGKSQVVFDLDLAVGRGEVVALLGRNGAGKTSTLLGITGVASARSAAIRVDGLDVSHSRPFRRVRSGIALVPSGSRAFPNLTVHENLTMVRGARNGTGWRVDDVYDVFPALAALKNSSGGQLSGGERQMLAIGRAMVSRPKVLMLDEPSEGLGPMIVARIGELLRELASEGLAVVLTEQNHRLALATADRAYFIEKGQVVWSGDASTAREGDLVHRYLAV
jgi:branched-chain amino acid transport system ATP-binding protein